MSEVSKNHCPLSEDFFYWPPEEINRYEHWCDVTPAHEIVGSENRARENELNKGKI